MKDEFKVKLEELKEKKATGEFKLAHLEHNEIEDVITEEDIKYLLSNFSGYVVSRNMPECKKFIQDFVKEVIFNMSFNLLKNSNGIEVRSEISRYDIYKRYSNSFYIRVS